MILDAVFVGLRLLIESDTDCLLRKLKEFYAVAVDELVFTTVSGIIAVCFVGFVLIEHWTATGFVLPMILLLYVDLLGECTSSTSIVAAT